METARARSAGDRRRDFRPDIEGLRAVAVLLVVLGHAGVPGLDGGYVGVDVFFVISGYLITGHLFRELRTTGRIRFAAFYARRMARLLPAAAPATVATVVAAWAWLAPQAARAVSMDAIATAAYSLNIRLAVQGTDYLDAAREPSPLQHFWSLGVEEQFYFLWPLLLILAATRRRAVLLLGSLAAGSFAVSAWQAVATPPWAYFGLQSRAWELAVGGLLALVGRRLPARAAWIGLALIAGCAGQYTGGTVFPGWAALLPVLGAALVVAGDGRNRLLGTRVLGWLGRLSYGWYLWHWPALVFAAHFGAGPWTRIAVAGAAALPAWLSLRVVERPLRLRRRGLVLGAATTAVTVGAAVIVLGLPMRVPGEGTARDTAQAVTAQPDPGPALLALIETAARTRLVPRNLTPPVTTAARDTPPEDRACLASLDETTTRTAVAKGCDRHGDPDATATVVLFGDSHTEQWFAAVDSIAKRRHWRLAVFTKSGCTPAAVVTTKLGTRRPYRECTAWREDALARIKGLHPTLVLLSSRTYTEAGTDAAWAAALAATADRLAARTVILQDTPDPRGVSVPDCVAAHPTAVDRCALTAETALYPARRAAITAAAATAVIDPATWFCTAEVCPAVVGNTLVYRDGSHVTSTYVRLLTPLLDAALPV
ncbi:acyltransferase [Dactylosporangium vinaceum]|uniref:Acyltransferase family protein n=1 Tax=Dactylosporangium vinaceum TaxID=53362 RepID=A0ABV5LZS0_9ACTN|nr:acyltransferase family protein [Dactylosporangium vinaceum]UAB94703.1 acyltransferase [Dactylosporangium vinaceum]